MSLLYSNYRYIFMHLGQTIHVEFISLFWKETTHHFMQCYHPGFHLQPSKNVVVFNICLLLLFLPYSCFLACSHVYMLPESSIHLFSLFVIYWCCHFMSHLLLPFWLRPGSQLEVGAWHLWPSAGTQGTGNKHMHSSCKTLCKASVIGPVSEGLWGRNFSWITHVSSMSQAFVSQRVPFHCSGHLHLDKGPGPCSWVQWRWVCNSLRNLCSWQVFLWFCWLLQATLTSQTILLLSESSISIFLPTVEIYINSSLYCLSHINMSGYFLQRDFMYIKVIVVQVVTWVHHIRGCCFIYIQGYITASTEGSGAQPSSATRTCEIISRARVANDNPRGNWNSVKIY